MVSVVIRLVEIELWVMFRYFEQFLVQILPEGIGNAGVTVFRCKDKMVVAKIHTMCCSTVGFLGRHPSMIIERRQ